MILLHIGFMVFQYPLKINLFALCDKQTKKNNNNKKKK